MGSNIVVRTSSGGAVSTFDPNPSSSSDIRDVVMHSDLWSTAYAIDANRVYRTTNSGTSWSDITGNLMSLAGNALQTIEYIGGSIGALLVGGNLGVFVSTLNALGAWTEVGSNLPNALVYDMRYNATDDILAVGTLGRGAWTLPNASSLANGDTTAPRVTDVKVSNAAWNSNFLASVDPGFGIGFPIPDGPNQQNLALPWTNINRIHIQFNENVASTFIPSNIQLTGVNVADYASLFVPITGVAFNTNNNVGTITLALPIGTDKLRLTILDNVSDAAGNALDGEWTDFETVGDSGNGVAGNSFVYRFNVLPGDFDGNGTVLGNDVTNVVNRRLSAVGSQNYSPRADIDASGAVLGNDVTAVVTRRLSTLPTGSPPEMLPALIGLSTKRGLAVTSVESSNTFSTTIATQRKGPLLATSKVVPSEEASFAPVISRQIGSTTNQDKRHQANIDAVLGSLAYDDFIERLRGRGRFRRGVS